MYTEEDGVVDRSNKNVIFTQDTVVCVPCETKSQHLLCLQHVPNISTVYTFIVHF